MVRVARMPAEDLGQPVQVEDLGRGENSRRQPVHMVVVAVAMQAERYDGVGRWPHRAKMIGEWVVSRMKAGQRPDAPAAEHFFRQ
jgi:hypothetical protein